MIKLQLFVHISNGTNNKKKERIHAFLLTHVVLKQCSTRPQLSVENFPSVLLNWHFYQVTIDRSRGIQCLPLARAA